MSLRNALQHDGGPYPMDLLASLREIADRDGLPPNADLVSLALQVQGTRPARFTREGVVFGGKPPTEYFRGVWAYVGSDEDGLYATEVPMRRT